MDVELPQNVLVCVAESEHIFVADVIPSFLRKMPADRVVCLLKKVSSVRSDIRSDATDMGFTRPRHFVPLWRFAKHVNGAFFRCGDPLSKREERGNIRGLRPVE